MFIHKFYQNGIVLVGIYVNDCMVIGCDEVIEKEIKGLKGYGFGLKVEEFLTDYLSCKVIMNQENAEVLVMQPHLLKGLEDKFEEEVNNLSCYATPGTSTRTCIRDLYHYQELKYLRLYWLQH
jgi:hypothetical protein